MTRISLY